MKRTPAHDTRRSRPLLVGLGVVGIALSLAAAIVSWALVDGAIDSFADTLVVTEEALTITADTIDVASDAVGVAGQGLESMRTVTTEVTAALASMDEVLSEADVILAESVPDGIDAARAPMPALITTFRGITDVLSALSILGVDFAPDPPPHESLRAIDEELAALADRLRDPSVRLARVGQDLQGVMRELGGVDESLAEMTRSLDSARLLLESYEGTTERATELVADADRDLATRRTLARALVVLLTAVLITVSSVPIVLGSRT